MDIVQVKNPKKNRYVKINKTLGRIISCKKSPGPYKHARIIDHVESDFDDALKQSLEKLKDVLEILANR